jgi:hypothetical protein
LAFCLFFGIIIQIIIFKGKMMKQFYNDETEKAMVKFYNNLNEKDKRYFSSISVMQLPQGGTGYIVNLLGVSQPTIYRGKNEILDDMNTGPRIRQEGAGRKPIRETYPNIDKIFLKVLEEHTAGDPMNKRIIWTDLTKAEIIALMAMKGIEISKKVVSDLFKTHGYVKRKIQKKRK